MIKELKELIMVVNQSHPDPTTLWGNGKTSASKLHKLYEGIALGVYHSDEEAAAQLYPEEGTNKSSYRKLKSTLREKLINALFDLDLKSSELNPYQKAYYDCHKQWAATKILMGKNANTAALIVALKLFKQTEQFEFTALAVEIASTLRLQYGIREGDLEKYTYYNQRFNELLEIYMLEAKAEQLYLEVIIPEVNSKEVRSGASSIMERTFTDATALLEKGNSYRLNLYVALVQLTYLFTIKDYAQALNLCRHHLVYFQSKTYEAHVPLQILYYQKMICLFNLQRYDEGEFLAQNCKAYMTVGTYNWFKCKEMLLQMAIYNQHYTRAIELYHLATSHPGFNLLPENVTEVWMIIKAHLYFIVKAKGLEQSLKKNVFKTFRSHKFNNETILYTKDKRGLNIAIQIIQFVILLVENKRAEAIDQVEALEQYAYRHLRQAEFERSRIFIRMIAQIPLSGFDYTLFTKKSEPFLFRLNADSEEPRSAHTEIEFIPYEHIWDILCELFAPSKASCPKATSIPV